jgi:hypothetical protein
MKSKDCLDIGALEEDYHTEWTSMRPTFTIPEKKEQKQEKMSLISGNLTY